ncbi:MAG TPA: ATP-binding cassette domain-containing protein [Gemmataceae bacterium]|nr:ATP-binding cassette domain-containing protein [Gemmataceae bacterium]
MTRRRLSRPRLLVPEVVQTSGMDCGPATLKCLLDGFGIPVHYGRLREACQTDVDGTSIDVLEQVACQMGLCAEQIMLPVNHVLLAEAEALPAIVVTRLPNGLTHFVLAWRRHGPVVQIMDPSMGRRWVPCHRFLDEIFVHTHRIRAETWYEWACSENFRRPLARRLRDLGLAAAGPVWIDQATGNGWRALAELDATTRLAETLVRAGGLKKGREIRRAFPVLLARARAETPSGAKLIPESYWSVLPACPPPNPLSEGEKHIEDEVLIRGAVLVRVRAHEDSPADTKAASAEKSTLSPELAAACAEPASRPLEALFRLFRHHGRLFFVAMFVGLLLAAGSSVLEAVLLRGILDLERDLRLVQQRLLAIGLFGVFAGLVLVLEWRVAAALMRLGRHLEAGFRVAFGNKIPRLNDRYFQSRPTSDMADRSHAIYQIRLLPGLAGKFVRAALTLVITAGAIAWIQPAAALPAFLAAASALLLPAAFTPLLRELDLRVRTHAGALSRFYLDALLGLAAIRAHGADIPVRREQESLLAEWVRASQRLLRWVVVVEGLQFLTGFGLAGWLLLLHAGRASDVGGALLLAYWALSFPVVGGEICLLFRQYPLHRNTIMRLLEPLGAPEAEDQVTGSRGDEVNEPDGEPADGRASSFSLSSSQARKGVAVTLEGVTVRAAGHTILEDIHVHIEAGSEVAIVGASGAGKSTLVGLLLGWHRTACGRVLIDGEPLDAARLDRLRTETAWVDPAVQLWNRSLIQNLLYGSHADGPAAVGEVLDEADLYSVVQHFPDGLQTVVGEGGGLLSGGQGQRVRLGRALVRSAARLVVFDEPFRGLDRAQRRKLLQRVRRCYQGATFLCITHDVGETREFGRVLVIDSGRVVEDGCPARLAEDLHSRYRALLDAEEAVRSGHWSSAIWRRLWLESGQVLAGRAEEGM